jgi:hypothetical protein
MDIGLIAWLLVAFVMGGLFWPWVMQQLQKFFKKNP